MLWRWGFKLVNGFSISLLVVAATRVTSFHGWSTRLLLNGRHLTIYNWGSAAMKFKGIPEWISSERNLPKMRYFSFLHTGTTELLTIWYEGSWVVMVCWSCSPYEYKRRVGVSQYDLISFNKFFVSPEVKGKASHELQDSVDLNRKKLSPRIQKSSRWPLYLQLCSSNISPNISTPLLDISPPFNNVVRNLG